MKALIDADVLLYECASVAEAREARGTEEAQPLKSFDFVKEVFDGRVADILMATQAEDYTLYLTGDGNFRIDLAVTKPYKGTRKEEKPYHYENLRAYITSHENCRVVDGMEADDAMATDQDVGDGYTPGLCNTVICTRDKDLRMVPGWHYGWECGRQPEFRMQFIDEDGWIELSKDRKSLKGGGLMFFYGQLLTGDRVDNIPGLENTGPVNAFDILSTCSDTDEAAKAVVEAYQMGYPDEWRERLLEQGRLLWMVRELHPDGTPVMWEVPDV